MSKNPLKHVTESFKARKNLETLSTTSASLKKGPETQDRQIFVLNIFFLKICMKVEVHLWRTVNKVSWILSLISLPTAEELEGPLAFFEQWIQVRTNALPRFALVQAFCFNTSVERRWGLKLREVKFFYKTLAPSKFKLELKCTVWQNCLF